MLPNATKEATEAYAKANEISVIANTPDIQAVKKPSLGLSFMAFYAPGECLGVKVSAPCLVSLSEKDGTVTVSVAEPTRAVDTVTVTLDGKYEIKDAPLRVKSQALNDSTVLTVDTSGTTCEPVRAQLSKIIN